MTERNKFIMRANLKTDDVHIFTGYGDDQWFLIYNAKKKETIPSKLEIRMIIEQQAEKMSQGEATIALASFELDKNKWAYEIMTL